jgi:hypothetical protein
MYNTDMNVFKLYQYLLNQYTLYIKKFLSIFNSNETNTDQDIKSNVVIDEILTII